MHLLIGRSPECQLVLDHPAVSRRHAAIRVLNGTIQVADAKSSNGTLVNARRILHPVRLEIDDRLDIGPFELCVTPIAPPKPTGPNKLVQSDTRQYATGADADLSGRIGKVALADIVQIVELCEKTGTLSIETADAQGEIVAVEGKPVSARFGDDVDRAAIVKILLLQTGTFQFATAVSDRVRTTITGTFSSFVLEAARQADEHRRSKEVHVESEARSFFDTESFPSLPADYGEKTHVLKRHVSCPACGQKTQGVLATCEKCGASLRAR